MNGLPFIIFTVLLSISFLIWLLFLLLTFIHREKPFTDEFQPAAYPKVSILKPVKHVEDKLAENIETFFLQDYPDYEIIIGVDFYEDPVYDIVKDLADKYPNVRSKIIATGSTNEQNPKIHKLARLQTSCTGDFYWIADSNVRINPYTLKKLMSDYIVNNSKAVFSPIKGSGGITIGSIIENAYLNFFVSGSIISAWKLFRQQIIVGKSILIEKNTLDIFGGFSYFKDFAAEDYMFGVSYTRSKIKISTNYTWILNYSARNSVKNFFGRITRWAKIRFTIKPLIYVSEIILNPIFISAFSILFLGKTGFYLFLFSLSFKIFLEYLSLALINHEDFIKPKVLLLYPACMIYKDILLFIIYFLPFFNRTINWKGRKIKIGKKSVIFLDRASKLNDGI